MIEGGTPGIQDAAQEQQEPKPVGVYQRSDEQIVTQIHKWFTEASDAKGTVQKRRREEWKQLAGDQWVQDDAAVAQSQKRPQLTLNMLQTIMAAVEGEERSNRQELKLFGEGQEDDAAAYGMNRLVKWVMNQCGGEFALSRQFQSQAAVGEGWVVPEIDFFEDPEGIIKLVYVDDEECFDDPLAQSPTSNDSRYFHRAKMMTDDELDARWPGKSEALKQGMLGGPTGSETDGRGYRDIYLTPNDTKSPKLYDAQKKMWCVLETWWTQIEPGWVMVNEQTGILEELRDEEFQQLKAQREAEQQEWTTALMSGSLPQVQRGVDPIGNPIIGPTPAPPALQASQRPIKCVYQAFTCHKELLEKRKSPLKGLKRIPYVPARGRFDKVKREWFGLLRDLIDPQRQHNVEQSVLVQAWQLMPKQAWYGPKGSFHNKNEWIEKIAQPGAMLEYNASRGKPEPVPAPTVPRHLVDLAFSRPAMMREICGVNTEMTGQRVGSDAGVVMEMRKRAATTVLAPLFDNFRQSKMETGRVLLAYIQTYIKPGRRIRVLGPEGAQYVQFTEQMGLERYDLTVDEANSTVNDRIATLNILQTTLPALMKSGMQPPPEFIDLMPMPPHIRDQWKRQIAWQMTISGQLPPPGWQPGSPIPLPPPTGATVPPGGPADAAPPQQ